ncbi:DNA cytosine methyltransferase [Bacteroides sp.]|uniref:DNA cytosine methyltransferase n=1 Tax=Bacteroides sp. TaxID=29523 RepID=UPI00260C69C4|nr:DNA cytosine methyltransferase [Bacteroides sp.]MDD3039516.1 DNA cytosine methyltransferase [Bacteroides sp.]
MDYDKLLTHGSLFSGIGGFDLAAEWAGFTNIFHADNNDFCRQALEHQFPNSDSYADITTTDFSKYRDRITVLTGGFPCQPFSLAGKRKGAADNRYLWAAMLGIIQTVRPTWVIGENVIGIASMVLPGEVTAVEEQATLQIEDHQIIETEEQRFVIDRICENLEQAGYSVQPIVIPACSIGAPHKRDRVWFVARLNEDEPASDTARIGLDNGCGDWQRGFLSDNLHGNASQGEPQWQGRQRGVGSTGQDVGSASNTDSYGRDPWWRARDGKSKDPTEWNGVQSDTERSCQEWPIADTCGERPQRWIDPDRSEPSVQLCVAGLCSRGSATERQFVDWSLFPTQPPIYPGDDGLPCQLAGHPFSHKKWRTEAVKACGNAIVPQVAYEILRCIREIEINR